MGFGNWTKNHRLVAPNDFLAAGVNSMKAGNWGAQGIAGIRPARHRSLARVATIQRLLRSGECLFAVIALLVLSGAVSPLLHQLLGVSMGAGGGSSLTRALLAPIYLIAGAVALLHFRTTIDAALRFPWAIVLPIFALLSTYWSISPEFTVRRSLGWCATTMVGIYFATRFEPAQLLRLLAWSLGSAAVVSLAVYLISPSVGVLSNGAYSGALRGVFITKNDLGRSMALAMVTLLVLRTHQSGHRWLTLGGLLLSGVLILLSESLTAVIAVVMVIGLLRFYRVLHRSVAGAVLMVIGFLLIVGIPAIFLASEAETILQAAGRDITLSGRTVLWTFVLDSIRQQPWVGYGFSAFWTESNSAASSILAEIHWNTPHAHNGFLDLMVELGVAGLALFLIGFGVALVRATRALRSSEGTCMLWPLTYLTFLFMYNLTESASFKQGSIYWVLYVATFCSQGWATTGIGGLGRPAGLRPRSVLSLGVRSRIRHRASLGSPRRSLQGERP